MTDHYEKARSLLHTAAGFAAVTAGMDPRTLDFAAYRDSVTSSTAAGQAYATLALADEVRALRQALAATTEPSGARGGEPTSEGATPA